MKMHKPLITLALLLIGIIASAREYYIKSLSFPPDATPEQKVNMAAHLVPSARQLNWQELELTAFLHFGVNTFTDREWGTGKEDPAIFNPSDLDAEQWVRTLRDAGFKLVILTAKHHDGFCLWPTATTPHSVASSPWRDGNGDVVADLRRACDKYDMKLGLYLSPWDRHAPEYGDSDAYNDLFVAQLTELLTHYGKIDEVWFDGACGEGPNGKRQEYDWLRFRAVMDSLQPDAVLAITGDDVRWVGNENGLGRETEWSATPLVPAIFPHAAAENGRMGLNNLTKDLGSRTLLAEAHELHWWPSEVDVSIRPGWFYHDSEQPHSLRRLAEIYLASVGRNSVLLLNVPPNRQGRISEADSLRLCEFHQWISQNFKPAVGQINAVSICEDIAQGQRVEAFTVMAHTAAGWIDVASGTTIGRRRIVTFPAVDADMVHVRVDSSRATPHILSVTPHKIIMPE